MARTGMSKGRPASAALKAQPAIVGSVGSTDAPKDLNPIGEAFWRMVFTSAKWLDPAIDGFIVREAALLAQDMAEARAEVARSGRYQTIPNGSTVRSAAVIDLEKLQVQQNAYLSALGLTPSDRARLGVHIYSDNDPLVVLARRREERRLGIPNEPLNP